MVSGSDDLYKVGKLVIRADAASDVGTGHIMRCLALAEAFHDRGGKAVFLSNCESVALRSRIVDGGFRFISVKRRHPDASDLDMVLRELSTLSHELPAIVCVVLDGYNFDSSYQKAIKEAGYSLLVVDDMCHLSRYYADILLNQNIHAEELPYQCDPDTKLLLGSRYALLRREFLTWRGRKREIPEIARKVLVTLGGADHNNVTFKITETLKTLNIPNLGVMVVLGPSNPHIKSFEKSLFLVSSKIQVLQQVNSMQEAMAWADIAISGGGSTCWEMACVIRLIRRW